MKSRLSFFIYMHNEHFLHNHNIIRMNKKSQHICSLQVDWDLASLSSCFGGCSSLLSAVYEVSYTSLGFFRMTMELDFTADNFISGPGT